MSIYVDVSAQSLSDTADPEHRLLHDLNVHRQLLRTARNNFLLFDEMRFITCVSYGLNPAFGGL